jgi:hypothetical protein
VRGARANTSASGLSRRRGRRWFQRHKVKILLPDLAGEALPFQGELKEGMPQRWISCPLGVSKCDKRSLPVFRFWLHWRFLLNPLNPLPTNAGRVQLFHIREKGHSY